MTASASSRGLVVYSRSEIPETLAQKCTANGPVGARDVSSPLRACQTSCFELGSAPFMVSCRSPPRNLTRPCGGPVGTPQPPRPAQSVALLPRRTRSDGYGQLTRCPPPAV